MLTRPTADHPDRTAIAAQMLAAVVATDPDKRIPAATLARAAVNLADALLRELAAPLAETAPDRAVPDKRQALLDSIGTHTLRYRRSANYANAEAVAHAVVALADYDAEDLDGPLWD
jgi:hypothetical protein